MTDRSEFWRVANRNRFRKLEKNKKARQVYHRRTFPVNLRRLQIANRKKYEKLLINEKYQFALDGYAFPHDTTMKAIEMDITLMKTQAGFDRCIRVGKAFDKLPKGFVILFSHWSITDVPFTTGIPHKYQVSLPYRKYLQPHQDRVEPYGVAQFINCCVSPNSPAIVLGGQDMRVAQCKFITRMTSYLRPELKKISPAYVKTTAEIPQGNELLLPSNYGGRHMV